MKKRLPAALLAAAMLLMAGVPALADPAQSDETVNYDHLIMPLDQEDPAQPEETVNYDHLIMPLDKEDSAQPEETAQPEEDTVQPEEETKPAMWYDAAVEAVTQKGIMTGTDTGFDPEGTVTRATVFQTLYNLAGKPQVDSQALTFADVQGKWYENAARWSGQLGLTEGTGDGSFAGDRAVTRAEMVTILYRYAASQAMDLSAGDETNILTYVDAELVAGWAVPGFKWAVGAGVVSGQSAPDGVYLAPGNSAIRAELAQILINFTDFFLPSAQ